jgi:hypothetical protein
MLDFIMLAKETVAFLAPFLPYLVKAGEGAAEEVGKKLGEAGGGGAWEKAKALWARLRPSVEAKTTTQEAVQELAANPQDDDARAALRVQLKKLFTEDESLAQEISKLQKEVQKAGVNVAAIGERSVAIAGNVTGTTIITGDRYKE